MTGRGAQSWVCLMYHGITADAVPRGGGPEYFAVDLATFERQLDVLQEHGVMGCSIAAALHGTGGRVAISFDDGVRSDYELAFPALARRGMTATFFVVTGRVGSPGHVTWSELREMRSAGMSIQSHSRSHPFLSELRETELRDELAGSKNRIDDELGQDTDTIALPGGDAPRRSLRWLLLDAGYRIVATSRWGTNAAAPGRTPRFLHRCTVAGKSSDEQFRRIVFFDRRLAARMQLREAALGSIRSALGPSRYAALRRRVLDGMLPWRSS